MEECITSLCLSLSLSMYLYIHTYIYVCVRINIYKIFPTPLWIGKASTMMRLTRILCSPSAYSFDFGLSMGPRSLFFFFFSWFFTISLMFFWGGGGGGGGTAKLIALDKTWKKEGTKLWPVTGWESFTYVNVYVPMGYRGCTRTEIEITMHTCTSSYVCIACTYTHTYIHNLSRLTHPPSHL